MSRSKISTSGAGGLGSNPFGGLSAEGLPEGGIVPLPKSEKKGKPKKSKGRVEIRREKAGRGGKTVTTLREFPSHIPLASLEAMCFDLKKICACGGTLKGRVVELQGDVCDRVMAELKKNGYQPVRAGG